MAVSETAKVHMTYPSQHAELEELCCPEYSKSCSSRNELERKKDLVHESNRNEDLTSEFRD